MNQKIFEKFVCVAVPLMKNSITIDKTLQIICSMGNVDENVKLFAKQLKMKIECGFGFAFALETNDMCNVSSDVVSLVYSGEQCGNLLHVLELLKKKIERNRDTSQQVTSVCVYPAVIVCVLFVGSILAIVFGKNFGFVFSEDVVSEMIIGFAVVVLLIASYLRFCVRQIRNNSEYELFEMIYFYLKNGFDVFTSLCGIICCGIKNQKLNESIVKVKDDLECGADLVEAFKNQTKFGNDIIVQLEIASKNGALCEACKNISLQLKNKYQKRIERILKCTEPVMIVFASVYLIFVMEVSVLPQLTSFGGVL